MVEYEMLTMGHDEAAGIGGPRDLPGMLELLRIVIKSKISCIVSQLFENFSAGNQIKDKPAKKAEQLLVLPVYPDPFNYTL